MNGSGQSFRELYEAERRGARGYHPPLNPLEDFEPTEKEKERERDKMKNELGLGNINTYVKGFIIDTVEDFADEVDMEISLGHMRKLTHCENVEVIVRYINNRRFAIVHGVAKSGKASALDKDSNIMLINSVIVLGVRQMSGRYEMRGLTDEELGFIKDNLGLMYVHDDDGGCNAYCLLNMSRTKTNASTEEKENKE